MDNYLGNMIEAAADKSQYDAQAKKILSDKTILAWILKYTTDEFRELSIQDIKEHIEEPAVNDVIVYPGRTNQVQAISGMAEEDKIPNEGEIRFDIRFCASLQKERIKLIINVEAQKRYNPGYDLVTRGIYYCARLLSSQIDHEFCVPEYDNIKKVYSIWICMDAPSGQANTIREYHICPQNIYGEFNGSVRYDLLSVITVCLGRKSKTEGNNLHKLLRILFFQDIDIDEKKDLLCREYGIDVTEDIEGGLRLMCNLSEYWEEAGYQEGFQKGEQALAKLNQCLIKEGQFSELAKANEDPEYRKVLYKKYEIEY